MFAANMTPHVIYTIKLPNPYIKKISKNDK